MVSKSSRVPHLYCLVPLSKLLLYKTNFSKVLNAILVIARYSELHASGQHERLMDIDFFKLSFLLCILNSGAWQDLLQN